MNPPCSAPDHTAAAMPLHTAVTRAARMLAEAGVHFGQGTDNAWDEAAWLVLWRLGLPLDTDLEDTAEPRTLSTSEWQAVCELLQRRIHERKPAAYLTREAWLLGVPFYVDERAIVPRSLLAAPVVDATLDLWLNEHSRRVLDLCTGNGSLAILAALAWPQVQVDALDLSADALAVAAINVERHGLSGRIRLLQSDALAALSPQHDHYDLVLCNPPYVNSSSMKNLPDEFKAEPELALAGGVDGMDFVRPLLHALPAYMTQSAVLALEIGHERAHFEHSFPGLQGVWLDTPLGSDQVVLLERAALAALSGQR